MTVSKYHNLVLNNISMAKKMARSRKRSTYNITLDELESAAMLGLVQAANSYGDQEVELFPRYAKFRIYGAMNDYLRELGWGPRNKWLQQDNEFCLENITDTVENSETDDFFDMLLGSLPKDHRVMIKRYYIDGDKISEIACDMEFAESRISQILTASRQKLQKVWEDKRSELWKLAA